MHRAITILAVIAVLMSSPLYADYGVEFRGAWPESWPRELEPLRKQSRTLEGPLVPLLHYAIPFTKQEELEATWPHLLTVKTKGAPIVLTRGPSFWLSGKSAGVCIHTPPQGEAPIADAKLADGRWQKTIYVELIVDGDIVDLNRIPLPPDTPIIDERFKDRRDSSPLGKPRSSSKTNDGSPVPETSYAEKLKANSDDDEALAEYIREMKNSVLFLVDQEAADPAQMKLDEFKSLLNSLKPSTPEGQQRLEDTKPLINRIELSIELARMSLSELEARLEVNPHDQKTLNDYTTKVFRVAHREMRSAPDRADATIKACRKRLDKLKVSADESLMKQIDGFERHLTAYDTSIAASRDLLALVGTDAVPLNVVAWVNGAPLTDGDLKGKVVLLDFGAVWCGPCIRTFPELRDWHEKYADKGLVIIGLTDYFNYAWNEDTGRAEKSEPEVSPEQEHAMLRKFAAHHDLPFRLGIQAGLRSLNSEMAKHYKVTGFPYVVVIDQAGKVRLLREGADQQNSKDIGKLLEQLLGGTGGHDQNNPGR